MKCRACARRKAKIGAALRRVGSAVSKPFRAVSRAFAARSSFLSKSKKPCRCAAYRFPHKRGKKCR